MNKLGLHNLIFGILFGACIPFSAWLFDIAINEHSLAWRSVLRIHADNPLHWIMDSMPLVLGMIGYIVGIHRHRLKIFTEGLEQKVSVLTQELQTKQAELVIREHELSEFINSAPVSNWMTGPSGRSVKLNNAILGFTGNRFEQQCTAKWTGEGVHPDDRGACQEIYQSSIANFTAIEHEYRWRNENGEYRWISEVGIPCFNAEQKYLGHTGISLDITDRKRSEQAIQLLYKDLKSKKETIEEANRAKSEFLAKINKEIRTPINSVQEISERLIKTDLNAKQQHLVQALQSLAESLFTTLNEFTGFSKIEANKATRHQELQSNTRILLVEDNFTNQELVLCMLEELDFDIDVVDNGRKALKALDRARYDLILMDCLMPEMNGFEATHEIRQRECKSKQNQPIPIIALTANTLKGDQEKCIEVGMNDFLGKPFTEQQLCEVIQRWSSVASDLTEARMGLTMVRK